jgi:hypothetical protein
MKKIVVTYIIAIFLISCNSKEQSDKGVSDVKSDTIKSDVETVETVETVIEDKFIDFPIPVLDSIFPYFETSGAVANSPSVRFYNPTDSGIFVFYTLFDKTKIRSSKYSFDEKNIGTLTTHTYRKPKYGWSETDKDQTFILLLLDGESVIIGKSIKIGATFDELTNELGEPIYSIDSSFVFLGKNRFIGRFNIVNGQVESLAYGRFNLNDSVFTMDSVSLREIVEEKLKGIKENK